MNKELIDKVPEERHVLKLLEECAELSEVLLKYLNKAEQYKPKKDKIVEEIGDVMYRMGNLVNKMGIVDEVNDRVAKKSDQIDIWFKENYK